MEVYFLASGELLARLDAVDFEGKTAKVVKQLLTTQLGVSRFRQKLFLEDGSREIPDDEVFGLAPVNVQLVVMELWPSDAEHDQQLMSACSKNDLVALEALLRCPRDPNVTGPHDLTPLHHAAGHGYIQPMQLLLEAAAKIDARSSGVHGMTPLHLAAGGGHLEAVGFLVQAGALKDSSDVMGATPLCSAAQEGCLEVVRYLLQQGAEKDQALDAGATPLFMAAQEGHLEIVRVLLESGADHQKARHDGATAVSIARQEGHWEVVRLLEEAEQT